MVQVGDTLRFTFGINNVNNRVVHIRAIVDDEQVVLRQWSMQKQRWIYQVEDMVYFETTKEHWVKL